MNQQAAERRVLCVMSPSLITRAVSALLVGPSDELESLFPDELPRELDRARSPASAIVRLAAKAYDIVLIDHTSEGELTQEQLAYLRAAQAAARPETRFIVIASNTTSGKVVEALRHGVFAYFSRPFDPDTVRYAIIQAPTGSGWPFGIEVLSDDPDFISVRLRCCLETAERMAQFMRELPCGLSDADKSSVSTAFSELLVNAIEHGGKLNSNEWVCVSRVRTKHTILYLIHDPGEGFSRPNLKHAAITNPPEDPTAHVEVRASQNMRPGGFGMLMATRLVDEVIYNARGNEVILIKYLEPGTNA